MTKGIPEPDTLLKSLTVLVNYHYQYRTYAPNHPNTAQLTTLF